MKMNKEDVDQLRTAFAVCRIAGIDAVVVTDNQIRGLAPTHKMALISPANLSFDKELKVGIGRIGEFEKRIGIFSESPTADGKENDKGEVSVLTFVAGKAKIQFRCTAERMIKYAKANEDERVAAFRLSKAEAFQISKAVKTLGAEVLTLMIGRDAIVKFECSAPTNESFEVELSTEAVFEDDPQGVVHIYEGDRFASVLDVAARDTDFVDVVLGELGSLTLQIKGHTIIALPNANMEEDDDE